MDLKIAGKTALITGSSKGIGRAAAEIFAAEGCNVILVSRSTESLAPRNPPSCRHRTCVWIPSQSIFPIAVTSIDSRRAIPT